MGTFVSANSLFARAGLPRAAPRARGGPSEYASLEALTDLVSEFLAEEDALERSQIAEILERVLGYGDIELAGEQEESGTIQWVDARVAGKRRVTILLIPPDKDAIFKGRRGLPAGRTQALVRRMEQEGIPWGLLSNGLRWRVHCRGTLLPALEILEVDLQEALEKEDEPSLLAGLGVLSAGAAAQGSLWDRLLAKERRARDHEARAWCALVRAAASELPAFALYREWAGLTRERPLLSALAKGLPEADIAKALKRSLSASGLTETSPPQSPSPYVRRGGSPKGGGEVAVLSALRAVLEILPQLPPASPVIALSSLYALAQGLTLAAGEKSPPTPPPELIRAVLRRAGAGAEGARILLAGGAAPDRVLAFALAEASRRMERGESLARAVSEAAQNLFAVDARDENVHGATRVLQLACRAAGAPAPYLSHHLRVGNPAAGAAVSSLGKLPAKSRRAASAPGRQISFVEVLFMDRLATLAGDLALLSAAGPERTQDMDRQAGIFRRLLRGVERFRDLADLWLLAHSEPKKVPPGAYESLVASLKSSDEEWARLLAPWKDALESFRGHARPFHWELEFPEMYVREGGPRPDPGFHVLALAPPQGGPKDLAAYYKSLAPKVSGKTLPLCALAAFASLFRASQGALFIGPLSATEQKAVKRLHPEAKAVGGDKKWMGVER